MKESSQRNFTLQQLTENFKTIKVYRNNKTEKIEKIEELTGGLPFIKRTFYEDKRDVFLLLQKADSPYLARTEAVYFGTETVVLEEYVEGETLKDYLTHTAVSKKKAARFVKELLEAVWEIHKLGIIHRDIKPENILVDSSDHIRLIDFGIARIYRPHESKDTELLGTVGYAPPEQFGYAQSDFRSDLFAVGMTCRDLIRICGKKRILQKIQQKCTKLDPEERYQNAGEVLREFQKAKWLKWIGGTACLFCFVLLMFGTISLNQHKEAEIIEKDRKAEIKEKDLTLAETTPHLFSGQKKAPCFFLEEGDKKETQTSLTGQDSAIRLTAKLEGEQLLLTITDASGGSSKFSLTNQEPMPNDYEGTSLYAEILFFDTNKDGEDEIWIAISDRSYLTRKDGNTAVNQNYMAGWCIYHDGDKQFRLAEGQLITYGSLEIGSTVPDGIWQEREFLGIKLKGGKLTPIN